MKLPTKKQELARKRNWIKGSFFGNIKTRASNLKYGEMKLEAKVVNDFEKALDLLETEFDLAYETAKAKLSEEAINEPPSR